MAGGLQRYAWPADELLFARAAFATGTALAARMPERDRVSQMNAASVLERSQRLLRDLPWLAAGLAGNLLLHGLMDVAPHTYPLPWRIDMAAALVLIVLVLALVRWRYTLLFVATFLGGLLTDLVDVGPSRHGFPCPLWRY